MEGATTPLAVRWADPLLQIKKRRAVEDSNAENRMVREHKGLVPAPAVLTPVGCCAAVAFLGLAWWRHGAPTTDVSLRLLPCLLLLLLLLHWCAAVFRQGAALRQ